MMLLQPFPMPIPYESTATVEALEQGRFAAALALILLGIVSVLLGFMVITLTRRLGRLEAAVEKVRVDLETRSAEHFTIYLAQTKENTKSMTCMAERTADLRRMMEAMLDQCASICRAKQ